MKFVSKNMFALSTATIFVLSGCMSKDVPSDIPGLTKKEVEKYQEQQENPDKCYEGGIEAPKWICDPYVEGGLGAVGSAQANPLGRNFQQTEAMANARDSLARELGTKVKNMFKNFAQTTGVGEDQTVEKVATNASKQIANQNIEGARQKNRWIAPDGTLFIHVVLDPKGVEDFKAKAKNTVKSSLRNEQALYQQFVAKKSMEELDAEIDKIEKEVNGQ